MRAWSLRRRLLGVTLAAALATWLVSAFALYAVAVNATGRVFDAAMIEAAGLLLDFADHEYVETGGSFEPVVSNGQPGVKPYLQYQVWAPGGRLLLRSELSPPEPFSPDATPGIGDEAVDGESWRVYRARSPRSGLAIQIGEPYAHRREAGGPLVLVMLVTLLVCSGIMLGALSWMIDRIALQMGRSARDIGGRQPSDLSPLPIASLPEEFAPLMQELNGLLKRLQAALEQERRFPADASHELRTPLAVIKTQAQVARRARNPEEAAEALLKLEAGVDRAAHLVEQLLTASRIDTLAAQAETFAPIDVRAEVQQVLELYRDLVARRQLRVRCEIADSRWLGNLGLARILLRNLIDNALRHGTSEVLVRYDVAREGQQLQVMDDGPGIAEPERARVFDPFYRVPGSASGGSGLGLAIVRHVVSVLGGTIELGTGLGGRGLGVTVRLPLAFARPVAAARR